MTSANDPIPECPPDRALFRAAADRPSAAAALPSALRRIWPQLVEAILAMGDARTRAEPEAQLAPLAHRLRDMGARPQDFLALHGAFEGVLSRLGSGADKRRAEWEAVIDAVLSAVLSEAFGLRARSHAIAA